jgi:hypothetical protein
MVKRIMAPHLAEHVQPLAAIVQGYVSRNSDETSRREALNRSTDELKESLETIVRDAESGKKEVTEELLDELRQVEEMFRRQRAELSAAVDISRRLLAEKKIQMRTSEGEEILSGIDAVLVVLRDTRWKLMAIRAESQPKGDSPIFDKPKDLLAFLRRNS